MALKESCVILIGIWVKEQTGELVDINCLDLPIMAVISSSFGSEFCVCADSITDTRTEYLPK